MTTAAAIIDRQFVEVLAAPAVSPEAAQALAAKPNVRVLVLGDLSRAPVGELRWCRLAASDDLQIFGVDAAGIARLDEQPARDATVFELAGRRAAQIAQDQHANVRLRGEGLRRLGRHSGRRQNLHELTIDDRGRRRHVQLTVESDDAAESRGWIGAIRTVVGFQRRSGHGYATRIRVLHYYAGGFSELPHALDSGVGIGDVVERQIFALQNRRRGNTRAAWSRTPIESRVLVRVFTVTQLLHLVENER